MVSAIITPNTNNSMDRIHSAVNRPVFPVTRRVSLVSMNSSFKPLGCLFFRLLSIRVFIEGFFGFTKAASPSRKEKGDNESMRKLPVTASKNAIVTSNVNSFIPPFPLNLP